MDSPDPLVPIPWETRNLLRPSFAVSDEVPEGELRRTLVPRLDSLKAAGGPFFVQARVPSRDAALVSLLLSAGFNPIETTLDPGSDLTKNTQLGSFERDPLPYCGRTLDPVSVIVVDRRDALHLEALEQMVRGAFLLDRFHVDPRCDAQLADRRYVCWIRDLWADASSTIQLMLKAGRPVGFLAHRQGHLALSCMAPEAEGKGLAGVLWLTALSRIRAAGIRHASSRVSVNNVSSLNLFVRLEFKLKNPAMVMHLWHGSGVRS